MIDSTERKIRFWKQNRYIILFSLTFLFLTVFFNDSLYGIFGEQNYLVVHLIIEVFIISMARHLNLDVIAEGVETSKQKDILFAQQCK